MGENDGWSQPPPIGLLPNGLLPGKASSVVRVLDAERWAKAEKRAAELVACIQPNPASEGRRNAVANYVQHLIMECFPCQVFTFGSVPLKTYLPDGDIDLTAFSKNYNLKDTWAHLVRDMLEREEKKENAEFRVKEVQYIQAEVKIIKCLVENIVVDISFDQLGGLCTLCFLEEVDNLVKQNHLFKRSIILIKAWCYYESRILGAHHGLISTYALETLVLYIFHVFNNSFAGPLEVLYRFLEFFSKFDWDNFCVSLWGPVPISSLPDGKAEPPRKDGGDLLLSKMFLNACGSAYAVFPGGQENQGQPFVSKNFNVIDPLRINNNLGRSVSKGNFFRIRSAFAFGAKRLARLLDCPKELIYDEVNQFFMNTWDRHGSGHRPDAPGNDLLHLRLSDPEPSNGSENVWNSSGDVQNENHPGHNTQVDERHSQLNNYPSESTCRGSEISLVSRNQKNNRNINNSRASDHSRNQSALNNKGQWSSKPEPVINYFQRRHLFARTRSSPELTKVYGEVLSHSRGNRASEAGKVLADFARLDSSRRKNLEPEVLASRNVRSSTDSSSFRHTSSHQSLDNTTDTNSAVKNFHDDLGLGSVNEDFSVAEAQGMQQEEQDPASATHGFNGQFHVPPNFASGHFPFSMSPSMLASMGYAQRNLSEMIPTNIPMIQTPWGTNLQFPQGLVSSPFTHYFPGGFPSNLENPNELDNDNFGSSEINPETEQDFWRELERGSTGFDIENGGFEVLQTNDKQRSTSEGYAFVPSARIGDSRIPQEFRESRSTREESVDSSQCQTKGGSQMFFDDRTTGSRSMSVSRASSVRSKTSSESSCDGTTAKISKPAREKQTRKAASSGMPPALSGRGKSVSELSTQADENARESSPMSGSEVGEIDASPQPTTSLIPRQHQMDGFEPTQTSGSDSVIQITPVLLGNGSQQRALDNSGGVPFAFYPTGPPVPFVAMLPFYNFPADTGTPDLSASHVSRNESLENEDSSKNPDFSGGLDLPEVLISPHSARTAAVELLEHKPDILNSDFASHVQNLQYGRFCQNSRFSAPVIYPSPAAVPPTYLQSRFPWDGPERPLAPNANGCNKLARYGQPRLLTVASPQSVSTTSANVYPGYAEEMPRPRSGTGTYFPNPISGRDWHSTNTRRGGNYGNDRYDHHSDREGNWNVSLKPRGSGRNHNRNQAEKSSPRQERSDRHWGSYRHESSYPCYHSQSGSIHSNSSRGGLANVSYGMSRPPAMKPSVATSDGSGNPSVMLYAYDHSAGYGQPAERLEFGSLGPMGFLAANEVAHVNESNISTGTFEEPRFCSSTSQRSSPDQPSLPNLSRGV